MSMIILASQSPRRKEILERVGLTFEIIPAKGEEIITQTDPNLVVEELSKQKAIEVASSIYQYSSDTITKLFSEDEGEKKLLTDTMVIGADTVVVYGNQILGKPEDEEDAFRVLSMLQGNVHKVCTGVTVVLMEPGGRTGAISFVEETFVHVSPMTSDEIWDYIHTGEPMDKAGSYGIQGAFSCYVEKIEGDYQNVVGFPIARFYSELKKIGIDIRTW